MDAYLQSENTFAISTSQPENNIISAEIPIQNRIFFKIKISKYSTKQYTNYSRYRN